MSSVRNQSSATNFTLCKLRLKVDIHPIGYMRFKLTLVAPARIRINRYKRMQIDNEHPLTPYPAPICIFVTRGTIISLEALSLENNTTLPISHQTFAVTLVLSCHITELTNI